jgi:hypothetical protein
MNILVKLKCFDEAKEVAKFIQKLINPPLWIINNSSHVLNS